MKTILTSFSIACLLSCTPTEPPKPPSPPPASAADRGDYSACCTALFNASKHVRDFSAGQYSTCCEYAEAARNQMVSISYYVNIAAQLAAGCEVEQEEIPYIDHLPADCCDSIP